VKIGDLVRFSKTAWNHSYLRGKIGIIEYWYCVTRGWVYVYWSDGNYNNIPVQEINLEVINESR